MRRSLLIHLHISESKWYQRQNKIFLVGSRSFQNLIFKASHRGLWRQTTYVATQFFTNSKIFWNIAGRRRGPLQGIFVEILPCSLFRFRFTYRATNGIRRCPAYKTPPWHRIPPKPPWHFSESEPRIWLWGRVSGEDRFDHLARVDAMLVKECCIAPGSESDNYYIVSRGCRLAGPCLRRFGQHTAISTLCSYFPRWWSAGLGLVSIRATSTLRLLTSNFSLACKSVSPHVEWPLNQYCCRFLIQSSSLRINQEHCMLSQ